MKKNIVKIALAVLALIPISAKAQITLTDDLLEKQVNKLYETLKNGTTTENTSVKGEIKLDKTNKTLEVTSDGQTEKAYYKINDDNTITFTTYSRYFKGMTYKEYQAQDNGTSIGAMGYLLIANMNNIKIEDAGFYFIFSVLALGLSESGEDGLTPGFMIIPDDADGSESEGILVIKESEFGQHALEVVKNQYGDLSTPKVISDNKENMINSYSYKISNDISKIPGLTQNEDEYYIIGEITVNPNANFSKINGYASSLGGDSANDNNDVKNDNKTEEINSTNNEEKNPKTGIENNYLILGISLIIGVFTFAVIKQRQIFREI